MKKAFTTTVQGDKSYTEIFNADQRFDKLWEQHTQKTDRFYANVRNSTFINWRFFNRPDKKEKIIEHYSSEKYYDMIESLSDPNKIELTHHAIIPCFLADAIEHLNPQLKKQKATV